MLIAKGSAWPASNSETTAGRWRPFYWTDVTLNRFVLSKTDIVAKQIPAAASYPRGFWLRHWPLELGNAREEQIAGDGDQDQVAQHEQGPEEIVPDNLAFIAYEARGRNADARGLWRDRLSDLCANRVDRRQKQRRKAEDLSDQRLELAEHRVGGRVAARQR